MPVRLRIAAAAAAWACLLACVPHPSADPVCVGSTVTATRGAVFVGQSGEVPRVFKPTTVNALLPRPGTGRGYEVCPGTDDGNGHLSVPNVPDGKLYFQRGTTFLETSARDLDLTSFVLGRADVVAATSNTPVTLQIANLESWSAKQDSIGLYSWNADVDQFAVDALPGTTGAPSDGATSATLGFDWSKLFQQNLPDSSKADQVLVTQYASRPVGTGSGAVAIKQAKLNITLTNGSSASFSPTLTDLPLSRTFSTTFKRSAFDGLSADVAPDAEMATQSLFVLSLPQGSKHGLYDNALELLGTFFQTAGATDVTEGATIAAMPSPFTPFFTAEEDFAVSRTFHGATLKTNGFVYVEDLLDNVDRGAIAPGTGPVTQPKIAGNDAFTAQTGVGLTPVVSWTAPSPRPDQVAVFVTQMKINTDGTVGSQTVATLLTSDDSVQIPDGILTSGETYFLFIDSITSVGASLDKAPFHYTEPFTEVQVVTQTFTP